MPKPLTVWITANSGKLVETEIPDHLQFSSVHSLSLVWLFATPWTAAHQASLSITNSQSLFKFMSIESVMPSNHSHPLSSPPPPAFNLSQHQGPFQWVSSSHQVAKVLEFQCQHQSFQWILGLISFRIDWLDLLGVQGTLKSVLHATVQKHQFFGAQLSLSATLTSVHDYWKNRSFDYTDICRQSNIYFLISFS